MSYVFKSLDVENIYNIKNEPVIIYQICGIPNNLNEDETYNVRKILITEDNILNVIGKMKLSKTRLTKLLKTIPENKYKVYPVKNLGDISMPTDSDITIARSYILSQIYDNNSGYASVF